MYSKGNTSRNVKLAKLKEKRGEAISPEMIARAHRILQGQPPLPDIIKEI